MSSSRFTPIKETLIELYDRLPSAVLILTEPLIAFLKTFFLFLSELNVRAFRVTVVRGEGKKPLTILFIAKSHRLPFLNHFLRVDKHTVIRCDSLSAWKINEYVKRQRKGTDATIINVNRILFRLLGADHCFQMPDFVRFVLYLSGTGREIEEKFHKNVRRKIGSFRKKQYTYTVSHDAAELAHFYSEMYVPYITVRFGARAIIEELPKVVRLFRTGFLLLVRNSESSYTSGAVCRVRRTGLIFELIGIEKGSISLLKEGALDALYYFAVRVALEKKCTHIDFGNSRPFLNDGIVRYKKLWGTSVVPNPKQVRETGIDIYADSEATHSFLATHYPLSLT